MASLLDLVKHYQHNIEKYPDDEQRVLKAIDKLFSLDVKVQHLQETGVGRTVNALRKEPGMVGKAARALVYKWKLMVASEESDQEEDHNDSSTQNGSEKDSDDGQHSHSRSHSDQRHTNGDHSGSKRKYHSEEEEPNMKKSRHSHSSESNNYKGKLVQPKTEPESDSATSDSHSESDDESESSEEDTKPVKIKIEPEDKSTSSLKHSNYNHSQQIKSESSSSKRSHDEQNGSKYSNHSSESKHSSDKTSKSTQSLKDNNSKHKEHSDKKYNEHSSDRKHSEHRSNKNYKSDKERSKEKEESKSSNKHNSEKQRASSSSQKPESSSDRLKSHEKSKSDKHSSSKSDKEKHKSSSDKEVSDKHKSKESSNSKEKSCSSKEKTNEKNSSSSKEKSRSSSSSHSKSEKKSSSDDKSNRDKSKSDSRNKSDRSGEKSSEKRSSHKSSSSEKSKSSSSKSKEDKPKKNVTINTDSDDDGIGCESGASFAEALGMAVPSKTKKKQPTTPIKDAFSPNNISNDLSPLSLLAPTARLAPLPALEISALPEISPHYKPRPPPKFIPHFTEEELGAAMSSKNQRTKVYSGNKIMGKVPSLYEMCVQILQEHIDALEYTGGVPYEILKPVVDRATPQQLFMLEHYNPYLMEDTDHLWQKHCEKTFRNKKRQEMETWREMFMRCQEEQEHKLKSLTANIKMTQEAKKAPVKQTKMAYVDTVVKPPRNIARKQAQHGTAHQATASPAARVAALAAAPNVLRGGVGGVRAPPAAPLASSFKPKKAPLMAKALQLMRGRKR